MKVVLHNAERDDLDTIFDSQTAQKGKEDKIVIICVEDDSTVGRNLKDVLTAIFVEFSFVCHSIKVFNIVFNRD